MANEYFNIKCFSGFTREKVVDGQDIYDFFGPSLTVGQTLPEMYPYVVDEFEEGRIDLVVDSFYGDLSSVYEHVDVILHINGIDNPLSILAGDTIMLPSIEFMNDFRYQPTNDRINKAARDRTLGFSSAEPNKSTRVDSKRTKYLESIAFPPTINQTPKPGVVMENGQIKIGGLG